MTGKNSTNRPYNRCAVPIPGRGFPPAESKGQKDPGGGEMADDRYDPCPPAGTGRDADGQANGNTIEQHGARPGKNRVQGFPRAGFRY